MNDVSPEFYWIAVAAVTILSAARLTRLAVYDDFPPVKWVREKFLDKTDGSNWQLLGICGYCASFWLTGLVVLSADLMGVLDGEPAWGGSGELSQPLWWIFNGTLAAAYLAATYIANDGDSPVTIEGDNS